MALTQISTAGVKDDAVTAGKIPADAVGSSELADNAVDTAAIADDAVTDAKLANSINTAIAANTAKVQTTINTNGDNRVITGSGTANTLNGQSNFTFDGNSVKVTQTTSSSDCKFILRNSNTPATGSMRFEFHHGIGSTEGTDRFRYGFVEGLRLSGSNDGGLAFGTKPDNAGAPSERMRIDSSGRVLIGGTSNPSGGSTRTLNLIATSSTEAALVFSRSNSLGGSSTGRDIKLQTNGDLTIDTHNVGEKLRFLNAGGITFNGDTAAANALDDYEEGTFTPTFIFGGADTATYTARSGSYTKIGNLVFAKFAVDISSRGGSGSGAFDIGGLPFTIGDKLHSTGQEVGGFLTYWSNMATAYNFINYWGQNGGTHVQVQYTDGNGRTTVGQYVSRSNLNDNTGIRGYVIYQT